MKSTLPEWQPTRFKRFIQAYGTSTGVAEIVTDAGRGYLKALGNKEGPHALACDWVGTALARFFELPTFDLAIMEVSADDEIPLGHGCMAEPGPAIVARAESGRGWGGSPEELKLVDNVADLPALVVFDTWVRNCDRHPPDPAVRKPNYDNVFLSSEGVTSGRALLKAIDHTKAFICDKGQLDTSVGHIERTKDQRVFGFFPSFAGYVGAAPLAAAIKRLEALDFDQLRVLIESIPLAWEVDPDVRRALLAFLRERAAFLLQEGIDLPVTAIDEPISTEAEDLEGGNSVGR